MMGWFDNLPENARRMVFVVFSVILVGGGWFFFLRDGGGASTRSGSSPVPASSPQQVATPAVTPFASAPAPSAGLSPMGGVAMPLPESVIRSQVETGQRVLSTHLNPNLSGEEKNSLTAADTLVPMADPKQVAAAQPLPVPQVFLDKYVFLSENQADQVWESDGKRYHVAFAKGDSGWSIVGLYQEGCDPGESCLGVPADTIPISPE